MLLIPISLYVQSPKKAVGTRDAALAEQQRLSDHKDHEVKRLTELLARTNKELDNVKEYVHSKDETVSSSSLSSSRVDRLRKPNESSYPIIVLTRSSLF